MVFRPIFWMVLRSRTPQMPHISPSWSALSLNPILWKVQHLSVRGRFRGWGGDLCAGCLSPGTTQLLPGSPTAQSPNLTLDWKQTRSKKQPERDMCQLSSSQDSDVLKVQLRVCVTSHDLSSDPQILSEESCSTLPSFLLFVSFQHSLVFPHYTLQPSGIERENRVATQSLAVVFRNTGHGEDKFSRDRTHLLSWVLLLTNSKQLDTNPG